MFRMTTVFSALAAFVFVASVQAASVDISTGSADWRLVSVPVGAPVPVSVDASGFVPGPDNVVTFPGDAYAVDYVAPLLTSPHAGWNNSLNGVADWIGATTDGASKGIYGWYVYELSISPVADGPYLVAAQFTSDNMVTSITLNGTPLTFDAQNGVYSFQNIFNVGGQSNVVDPLVLQVVVYNEFEVSGTTNTNNPTGLILAGDVTLVPLPAAAWAGLALLGGLGVKRRFAR
jgi:hypothetical protein